MDAIWISPSRKAGLQDVSFSSGVSQETFLRNRFCAGSKMAWNGRLKTEVKKKYGFRTKCALTVIRNRAVDKRKTLGEIAMQFRGIFT